MIIFSIVYLGRWGNFIIILFELFKWNCVQLRGDNVVYVCVYGREI